MKADADSEAIREALSAIDNARISKGYANLDDLAKAARVAPRTVHYWRDKNPTSPKYADIFRMLALVGLTVKIVPVAEAAEEATPAREGAARPLWRVRADVLLSRLAQLDAEARGAALGRFEDAIEKEPPRLAVDGRSEKQGHGSETFQKLYSESRRREAKNLDSVIKTGKPAPTSAKTKIRKRHP